MKIFIAGSAYYNFPKFVLFNFMLRDNVKQPSWYKMMSTTLCFLPAADFTVRDESYFLYHVVHFNGAAFTNAFAASGALLHAATIMFWHADVSILPLNAMFRIKIAIAPTMIMTTIVPIAN